MKKKMFSFMLMLPKTKPIYRVGITIADALKLYHCIYLSHSDADSWQYGKMLKNVFGLELMTGVVSSLLSCGSYSYCLYAWNGVLTYYCCTTVHLSPNHFHYIDATALKGMVVCKDGQHVSTSPSQSYPQKTRLEHTLANENGTNPSLIKVHL